MEGFGLIDGIVKEPLGGAHNDPETMARTIKKHIKVHLDDLIPIEPQQRVTNRILKYEQMGRFKEA